MLFKYCWIWREVAICAEGDVLTAVEDVEAVIGGVRPKYSLLLIMDCVVRT